MTLTGGRLHGFAVDLRIPHVSAAGRTSQRSGYLVELSDDLGHSGWGEAAPLPGHSPEALEEVGPCLVDLIARTPGMAELELIDRAADAGPTMPSVLAAIDTAILDLTGQRRGASIAHMLSEEPRETVAVNAVISHAEPDGVAAGAGHGLDNGYSSFKLKVAAGEPATDVARVRALRNALGPEPAIRLDANRGWSAAAAVEVLGAVADLDIEYVEEPVADPADLVELRRQTDVAVAADETLSAPDASELLAMGLFDIAVIKPSLVGGPTRAMALAGACDDRGIGVVISSLLDTAVGLTAALHVAAGVKHPRTSGLGTGRLIVDDVADGPVVENGHLAVPRSPGLGVTPRLRGS